MASFQCPEAGLAILPNLPPKAPKSNSVGANANAILGRDSRTQRRRSSSKFVQSKARKILKVVEWRTSLGGAVSRLAANGVDDGPHPGRS